MRCSSDRAGRSWGDFAWCHTPPALRGRLHRAVVQALKPGGVFPLEAYTPQQLQRHTGGPRTAELLVPLADVIEELAGLDLLVAEEKFREVNEGTYHDGMSAVVQVIARKA